MRTWLPRTFCATVSTGSPTAWSRSSHVCGAACVGRSIRYAALNERRERQGTLEPADESLFRRCDNLVKRLKGADPRRRQAEGHDDYNTFNVLAAEGFLPGYGLEAGSVVGWAEIPFWRTGGPWTSPCRGRRRPRCASTYPATSSTPTATASWRGAFAATSTRSAPRCRNTRLRPTVRR